MGNTFAALRTQVGVAKETTKGTAVAASFYPAVKKFDPQPKQAKLTDAGWRGSMGVNYGMQNGPRYAEIDVSSDLFVDSAGWFLAGILGADTVTGASDPFTHTMALLNTGDGQPTSQTWTDTAAGIQTRQFNGAQVTEATIKYDPSGFASIDAKLMSFIGATASAPTATYTTLVPVPSWVGTVTIGGTSTATIENLEIALKRNNAEAIFTMGTQDPYQVHVGELVVTTKYTFVAADDSRMLAYLAGTTEAVVATLTQSGTRSLVLQMTQHQFDDAKYTRGKSYVELEGTGQAIFNSTDATAGGGGLSPIQAVFKNQLTSGTYV